MDKYSIRVTEETSAGVQKQLFREGVTWTLEPRTSPKHTEYPFLVVTVIGQDKRLGFGTSSSGVLCNTVGNLLYYIKKDQPQMRIGDHEVKDVTRNSAKVGCTTVSREDVQALLDSMDRVPEQEFPVGLDQYDVLASVNACKEISGVYKSFMDIRGKGNYTGKGFFLGKGWSLVYDDRGEDVLVRTADIV